MSSSVSTASQEPELTHIAHTGCLGSFSLAVCEANPDAHKTRPPQAFTTDGFLCAAILVYELMWKRRATVVKSSLVQQFAVVAMRSSGLVGESLSRRGRGLFFAQRLTRRVQRSCSLARP